MTKTYYTLVEGGLNDIPLPENSVLITDSSLDALYPLKLDRKIFVPKGEAAKTLKVAENCWQQMHEMGLDRRSTVIALGGGSVTDLAGFVAAAYMRGISSIYIPTTLLAMVDAAIGGKTGVNLPTGKSIVGVFHMPLQVYILPKLLETLPESEMRSGMAEVVKYGVIWDAGLFEHLEQHGAEQIGTVIDRCCAIKSEVVARDATEQNIRAILNYGHTFAHAIETATKYQCFLHGEAVSIGMSLAARFAFRLGWVDETFVRRQDALLQKFGLPIALPKDLRPEELIALMKKDKKSVDGTIHLILPKKLGSAAVYPCRDISAIACILK